MKRPLFSICIAAYNAGEYIDECLQSIAAQSESDYEVIVVDDGSKEPLYVHAAVKARLPSFTLKRISNSGPYAARQVAFDIARGKYLLCVDADDRLVNPSALRKLKSVLATNDVDVIFYNATASECDCRRLFDYSSLGVNGRVSEDAVWSLYSDTFALNSLCCKTFKRSLYSKCNDRRPRLLMAEDRLQSLEIMRNAKNYWLIDEPLYFYRPNAASTTNAGYNPAFYRQTCIVEEQVLSFLEGRGMLLSEWAHGFLDLTSRVLLGIFYNVSLSKQARAAAYKSMCNEKVLLAAFSNYEYRKLPFAACLRLSLMKRGSFTALEASMLPWKIGSVAKHFAKKMLGRLSEHA